MSRLAPALDAELRADAPTIFGAIAIDLPDAQINLLDGAGTLSFAGRVFVGADDTYGTISEVEDLTDGLGDSAPAFSLTLLPASDAAAAALAAPTMQGAAVYAWIGAVNVLTGQPIPDPHLVFAGELDVPVLESSENSRRLEYEVVSVFERLFEDDESVRLSPGQHRGIFPNEAGMDGVTGVAETVYWGVASPPSNVIYGGGGGSIRDYYMNRFQQN